VPRALRPEFVFVAIAAISGAVVALFFPAPGGYDEPLHVARVWQLADGGLFARQAPHGTPRELGGYMPIAFEQEMLELLRDNILSEHAEPPFEHLGDTAPRGREKFIAFSGAAVYSPVPYIPSVVAMRVGRWIGVSTLALVFLSRLAGLAAYIGITALAIRRLPARRWVLAVIALTPVALVQASTVSADGVTLALTFLVVAEALRLFMTPTAEITRAALIETAVATIALALTKQPYMLVAALLILPMWRHRDRVLRPLAGTLGAALAVALLWTSWAQARFVPPHYDAAKLTPDATYAFRGADPDAQLRYLRDHPLEFFPVVVRTLTKYPGVLFPDVVAQLPRYRPPGVLVVLVVLVIVAAWIADPARLAGGAIRVVCAGAVAVGLLVGTIFLGWTGWNEVGAPRVDALQGRYLLPVVAVLFVATVPTLARARRSAVQADRVGLALVGVQTVLLVVAVGGLLAHFYP
jgi:uncharacterized membrane protein